MQTQHLINDLLEEPAQYAQLASESLMALSNTNDRLFKRAFAAQSFAQGLEVSMSDEVYGWVDGININGALALSLTDVCGITVPKLYLTQADAQAECNAIQASYDEQIISGDRDEDDEYEGYPYYVCVDGDICRELDPTTKEVFREFNWRKVVE